MVPDIELLERSTHAQVGNDEVAKKEVGRGPRMRLLAKERYLNCREAKVKLNALVVSRLWERSSSISEFECETSKSENEQPERLSLVAMVMNALGMSPVSLGLSDKSMVFEDQLKAARSIVSRRLRRSEKCRASGSRRASGTLVNRFSERSTCAVIKSEAAKSELWMPPKALQLRLSAV